jgi:CubicO group peptidase (beta-lactamase class C family)
VPDHVACKDVYAVGHTGSTGTALWIDPRTRTWMVLLTNRVYQLRRKVEMQEVRPRGVGEDHRRVTAGYCYAICYEKARELLIRNPAIKGYGMNL